MRARVDFPTRRGPSMAMKRGAWGPRLGMGARLAEESSAILVAVPFADQLSGRKARLEGDYSSKKVPESNFQKEHEVLGGSVKLTYCSKCDRQASARLYHRTAY